MSNDQATYDDLYLKYVDMAERRAAAEQRASALYGEIVTLEHENKRVAELKQTIDQLNADLDTANATITDLETDNARLRSQVATLRQGKDVHDTEFALKYFKAEAEREALQQSLAKIRQELAAAHADLAEARVEYRDLIDKIRELAAGL